MSFDLTIKCHFGSFILYSRLHWLFLLGENFSANFIYTNLRCLRERQEAVGEVFTFFEILQKYWKKILFLIFFCHIGTGGWMVLALPAGPCISESCIEIKFSSNFCFYTFLWCLKSFKVFIKPFEVLQRRVKIKI